MLIRLVNISWACLSSLTDSCTYSLVQVVYPLDVIRRRMQVQQSGQHRTSATVLRSLTIQQLFSGLSATYLKVMPAAAISLLVRDALLGRLSQQ